MSESHGDRLKTFDREHPGVIVINLKTYRQGSGKRGLELLKIIERTGKEYSVNFSAAAAATDIYRYARETEVPILAQHIDDIGYGSHTGFVLPEAVVEAGAAGTLINHAEHRLRLAEISALVKRARELELASIVCTNDIPTTTAAAALAPDYVAVEPPELIGGDISVSTAKPEIVSGSVEAARKIDAGVPVLCGAGVKNGFDIKRAGELGSPGVLLASGVVCVNNPAEVLADMAKGILA